MKHRLKNNVKMTKVSVSCGTTSLCVIGTPEKTGGEGDKTIE